ncbi:MAG TPA: hypothetical protein VNY05_02520 [Candidatus Acidoferrales bacterium]|jgi:hypothetical protein|nr:hypothetical protein [Candidatus Acidoferrales bacterium]
MLHPPGGTRPATPGDDFPWIVALVLAIVPANSANLRWIENQRHRCETDIRQATAAGRAALLRQHLSESLLLAGSATGIGLPLAACSAGAMLLGRRWRRQCRYDLDTIYMVNSFQFTDRARLSLVEQTNAKEKSRTYGRRDPASLR